MVPDPARAALERERGRLLDIRRRLARRHHARFRAFLDARLAAIGRQLADGERRDGAPDGRPGEGAGGQR